MSDLTVRRLLIDLEQPFDRLWNGGDAFRTAYFNALSMSFPVGEQFFIDSVRGGVKALPAAEQERFAPEVKGFIGQEATHRRIHALFNGQLEKQGHVNRWAPRITHRLKRFEGVNVRHTVAMTAATEHLTAILSEHLLAYPGALEGSEPRLATMWMWHAAEETEHRSTAFDVYRALGGSETWRRRWFLTSTMFFTIDVLRQTADNLRHDGMLWRWSTWRSGARFFFGRDGLARRTFKPWFAYLRADFHPSQADGSRSLQWLRDNATAFTPVA